MPETINTQYALDKLSGLCNTLYRASDGNADYYNLICSMLSYLEGAKRELDVSGDLPDWVIR